MAKKKKKINIFFNLSMLDVNGKKKYLSGGAVVAMEVVVMEAAIER